MSIFKENFLKFKDSFIHNTKKNLLNIINSKKLMIFPLLISSLFKLTIKLI